MHNAVPEGASLDEFKEWAWSHTLTFKSSVELQTAHAVANWKDLQHRQATCLLMRETDQGKIFTVVLTDEVGGLVILPSECGEHSRAHAEEKLRKHLEYGYVAKLARVELL